MVELTASDGRSRTSEQVSADDADLQAGIENLAGLVAGSLGLPGLLAEVASFAVRAIPGADGAGVTLLRLDRSGEILAAVGAGGPFVARRHGIQDGTLQGGRCITAGAERRLRASRVVGWGGGWR